MQPHIHCSIIYGLAKHTETTKCPPRQMMLDKEYVQSLSLIDNIIWAIKEKEIFHFVTTWTGLEAIILSEINQIKKDKYHMISLIYGI